MFGPCALLPTVLLCLFACWHHGYCGTMKKSQGVCYTSPRESCKNDICSEEKRADNVCIDNSCDKTMTSCTEAPRSDGDNSFPCKILTSENCRNVDVLQSPDTKLMKPPRLKFISTYPRSHSNIAGCDFDDTKTYPALNVSFTLPFGHHLATETTAIKLFFTSSCEKDFGIPDCYYYRHPRFRLFDFQHATLGANDIKNPRIINYPCLIGLAEQDETFYDITLTSYPYVLSVTYRITTYDLKREWQTTVAVAVLPGTKDVHVIFTKTTEIGIKAYHIYLISYPSKVIDDVEISVNSSDYVFSSVSPGLYKVKISIVGSNCNKNHCNDVVSSFFEVKEISSPDDNEVIVVLVVIVGCLIGLILIGVLGYIVKDRMLFKPRDMPTLKVLVLHQYVCDAQSQVVLSLVQLMRDIFKCHVTEPESHLSDIHKSGHLNKWLQEELNKHDKIVLLYPKSKQCQMDCCNDAESNNNMVVKDALAEAEQIILCHGSKILKKVVQVHFKYSAVKEISNVLNTKRKILLMKDIKKFYKTLYSVNLLKELKNDKNEFISSRRYFKTCAGKRLKENMEKAMKQMSCNCRNNDLYALNNFKNRTPSDHEYIDQHERESLVNLKSYDSHKDPINADLQAAPMNEVVTSAQVHNSESEIDTARKNGEVTYRVASESGHCDGHMLDSTECTLDNFTLHSSKVPARYSTQPEFKYRNRNPDAGQVEFEPPNHQTQMKRPKVVSSGFGDLKYPTYAPPNSRMNFNPSQPPVLPNPSYSIRGSSPRKNPNTWYGNNRFIFPDQFNGVGRSDWHGCMNHCLHCNTNVSPSHVIPNGSLAPNRGSSEKRPIQQSQNYVFDCKHGYETGMTVFPNSCTLRSRCPDIRRQNSDPQTFGNPVHNEFISSLRSDDPGLRGMCTGSRQISHPPDFGDEEFFPRGAHEQFAMPSEVLSDPEDDCESDEEFLPPDSLGNSETAIDKLMEEACEINLNSPGW